MSQITLTSSSSLQLHHNFGQTLQFSLHTFFGRFLIQQYFRLTPWTEVVTTAAISIFRILFWSNNDISSGHIFSIHQPISVFLNKTLKQHKTLMQRKTLFLFISETSNYSSCTKHISFGQQLIQPLNIHQRTNSTYIRHENVTAL